MEREKCPDCGSSDLYPDEQKGEIVCNSCGLVVEDKMIDTTLDFQESSKSNIKIKKKSKDWKVPKLHPESSSDWDHENIRKEELVKEIIAFLRSIDYFTNNRKEELINKLEHLKSKGLINGLNEVVVIGSLCTLEVINDLRLHQSNIQYYNVHKKLENLFAEMFFIEEETTSLSGRIKKEEITPEQILKENSNESKSLNKLLSLFQEDLEKIVPLIETIYKFLKESEHAYLRLLAIEKEVSNIGVKENNNFDKYKKEILKGKRYFVTCCDKLRKVYPEKFNFSSFLEEISGPRGYFEVLDSKYKLISSHKPEFVQFIEKELKINLSFDQKKQILDLIDYASKYALAVIINPYIQADSKDKCFSLGISQNNGLICACVRYLINRILPRRSSKDPAISIQNIINFIKKPWNLYGRKYLNQLDKEFSSRSQKHLVVIEDLKEQLIDRNVNRSQNLIINETFNNFKKQIKELEEENNESWANSPTRKDIDGHKQEFDAKTEKQLDKEKFMDKEKERIKKTLGFKIVNYLEESLDEKTGLGKSLFNDAKSIVENEEFLDEKRVNLILDFCKCIPSKDDFDKRPSSD